MRMSTNGQITDHLKYDQHFSVHFRIRALETMDDVTFGFGFHTTDFFYLTTHNSEEQLHIPHLPPGEYEVTCNIARMPLLPGVYSLRFGVTSGQASRSVYYGENLMPFRVIGEVPITIRRGFIALDANWALADSDSSTMTLETIDSRGKATTTKNNDAIP